MVVALVAQAALVATIRARKLCLPACHVRRVVVLPNAPNLEPMHVVKPSGLTVIAYLHAKTARLAQMAFLVGKKLDYAHR